MARPLIGMLALLAAVIAVAVAIGATHVSWRAFIDGDAIARAIILRIRLPRVIVGALIGATLAVSGVTFQTLLRNPLADPFILGVSGGAACGAAIASAFGFARIPGLLPIIAFAGAIGATSRRLECRRMSGGDATTLSIAYCGQPSTCTAFCAPLIEYKSSTYVLCPATYSGSAHAANKTRGAFARLCRCR